MPNFNDERFKEAAWRGTDIVGLISECVELQPERGGRQFRGSCPFHDDSNASLVVYADRGAFKCWSCCAGGDCFAFLMKRENVLFLDALKMLAQRAGLEAPQ